MPYAALGPWPVCNGQDWLTSCTYYRQLDWYLLEEEEHWIESQEAWIPVPALPHPPYSRGPVTSFLLSPHPSDSCGVHLNLQVLPTIIAL